MTKSHEAHSGIFESAQSLVNNLLTNGEVIEADSEGKHVSGFLDGYRIEFNWSISGNLNLGGNLDVSVRFSATINGGSASIKGQLLPIQKSQLMTLYRIKCAIADKSEQYARRNASTTNEWVKTLVKKPEY